MFKLSILGNNYVISPVLGAFIMYVIINLDDHPRSLLSLFTYLDINLYGSQM